MSAIEGQVALSKTQRALAALSRGGRYIGSHLKPGASVYSVLFGAAAGVGLAGGMYIGRTFKVAFFDTDYLRQQSRLRYNEKQTALCQLCCAVLASQNQAIQQSHGDTHQTFLFSRSYVALHK